MTQERLLHTTNDSHTVAIHYWPSNVAAPKGVVVWLHGMAEHGGRYGAFARYLNNRGWHLYCPDHRGHGESIGESCPKGHFSDRHGWKKVVNDAADVVDLARERHPGLPCVLGGHSMGSFIALAVAETDTAESLAGLVLCGSDYPPAMYYNLMQLPIQLARLRNGGRGSSPLIRKMTFGAWAGQVPEPTTDFDWLSTEPTEVNAYIEDPLCGFDCSTETWLQLVQGLRQVHSVASLSELPEALPVLLLGGEADPMSNMGKGMMALENVLHAMEQPVKAHFWPEGRHEILNDQCRDDVHQAVGEWLERLEGLGS